MSFLRSTDVKKHLGRSVRRFVSQPVEDNLSPKKDETAATPIQKDEPTELNVTAGVSSEIRCSVSPLAVLPGGQCPRGNTSKPTRAR